MPFKKVLHKPCIAIERQPTSCFRASGMTKLLYMFRPRTMTHLVLLAEMRVMVLMAVEFVLGLEAVFPAAAALIPYHRMLIL